MGSVSVPKQNGISLSELRTTLDKRGRIYVARDDMILRLYIRKEVVRNQKELEKLALSDSGLHLRRAVVAQLENKELLWDIFYGRQGRDGMRYAAAARLVGLMDQEELEREAKTNPNRILRSMAIPLIKEHETSEWIAKNDSFLKNRERAAMSITSQITLTEIVIMTSSRT